jgi:GNAT superfamily N-acetyltransferase
MAACSRVRGFVRLVEVSMRIEVSEEPVTTLDEHAAIPIVFEVESVLDVADPDNGLGEFALTERTLDVPFIKDYDAMKGEHPAQWATRFDVSNWGSFAARVEGRRVGGAVVAFNTPGITLLSGRKDLALLWDIRVSPQNRGQGIGSALFLAAEAWARARGCRGLKIETQNINVPACRFYARQGCALSEVHRFAYLKFPDEIQLLWYKELT